MRLKLIVSVNFQRSEAENFQAVMKKHPHLDLGPNEVVCMVSLARNQMVFMYRREEVELVGYGQRRGTADLYRSERLRLSRSTWDHRMLQNYANQLGIQLDGFRRFEEIFPHLKEAENVININRARKTTKAVAHKKAA